MRTTKATNRKGETMNEYLKGDKIEYTGKTEVLYGAVCYEAIWVEGHRTGKTLWTYRAPRTAGR